MPNNQMLENVWIWGVGDCLQLLSLMPNYGYKLDVFLEKVKLF